MIMMFGLDHRPGFSGDGSRDIPGTAEGGEGGGGLGGFSPPLFWMVKKYFIYLTISITYKDNLHYILISTLRFSLTNLNGRLDVNREIMGFQLLFLFSFVLESAVFHEDKVSSLNKLEGVFAQRHSFMKATYRRKY